MAPVFNIRHNDCPIFPVMGPDVADVCLVLTKYTDLRGMRFEDADEIAETPEGVFVRWENVIYFARRDYLLREMYDPTLRVRTPVKMRRIHPLHSINPFKDQTMPMPETNPLLADAPESDQLACYEQFVDEWWVGGSPDYTMIAFAGEVGESCNTFKKLMRLVPGTTFSAEDREKLRAALRAELGDSLFYLVRACHDAGTTLAAVMRDNEEKLRKKFGGKAPDEQDIIDGTRIE